MTFEQKVESPAPKDLGALDSCDKHRNEGGRGMRAISAKYMLLFKAITSSQTSPHSSHETPDSTLDGIGSFSHSPFSFPSQTPSFGMTKR